MFSFLKLLADESPKARLQQSFQLSEVLLAVGNVIVENLNDAFTM